MMARPRTSWWWLSLALGALSCGDSIELGTSSGGSGTGSCEQSSDCPGSAECVSSLAACYVPSALESDVDIQILPPPAADAAVAQFPAAALGDGNTLNATVGSKALVVGNVTEITPALGNAVPGTLIAVSDGDIPGSVLRSEARVGGEANTEVGAEFAFALEVVPSRPYRVSFYPDNADRPSEAIIRTFEPGASELSFALPKLDPGDSAYPTIRGTVSDRATVEDGEPATALAGVRVTATAVGVGSAPPELPLVSTSAITDSKLGEFELRVPARAAAYALRFEATAEMEDRIIPTIQTNPEFFAIVVEGSLGESVDAGSFIVDSLPRLACSLTVTGRTSAGALEPVEGAQLTFRGQADDGTVTLQGETGATPAGLWTGELIEADYVVEVVPPNDSPFQSKFASVRYDPDTRQHTVELSPRLGVEAEVVGWDGTPVPGASVSARRDESEAVDSDVPGSVSLTEASDTDGRFERFADTGRWLFTVSPPAGSPYGRLIDVLVELDEASVSSDGTVKLQITLPLPQLIQGTVGTENGSPVPSTIVEVYRSVATGDADDAASASPSARLLGDGITDDAGRYWVLVTPLDPADGGGGIEIAP